MSAGNKSFAGEISCELGNSRTSTPLFPCAFVLRDEEQLSEYVANKFTNNRVVHDIKLILGSLTLILPIFNVFMVYRSFIAQQGDRTDVYSIFHSMIFYGEFIIVHLLFVGTLLRFLWRRSRSQGQWLVLLDVEFTLMAFNLLKLIPILSLNGYKIILMEIALCAPILLKSSRSSRILGFTLLSLIVFIELIFLLSSLMLLTLIKVYQVAFVGEQSNPLSWTVDQWLLFLGFAANIINITDTPTISQLSFMWGVINKRWSEDSQMWLHDRQADERKVYMIDQICRTLGFVKTFLWLRTMTADDVHSLVRLPPST